MKHSVQFGSREISFTLEYAERKTLGISVNPMMEVNVSAPAEAPLDKIKQRVKKKAPWILKQQLFFSQYHPKAPEKKYVSGESHLFLGRQYKLIVTVGVKNEVHYKGNILEVTVKDRANAKALLEEWYTYEAKRKFPEIAEPWLKRFARFDKAPKGIYVQAMKTRWGSCTPSGRIILNPELIKAPKPCIEYVILHELCHLVHHNHSGKFYALMERHMPDWRKWKAKLERA